MSEYWWESIDLSDPNVQESISNDFAVAYRALEQINGSHDMKKFNDGTTTICKLMLTYRCSSCKLRVRFLTKELIKASKIKSFKLVIGKWFILGNDPNMGSMKERVDIPTCGEIKMMEALE